MDEFGYTVPTTWQEWAALGEKVATEHPGYIVGNIGDSYSHWIYLWGNQCPLQQLDGDELTDQRRRRALHPGGRACSTR